MKAKKMIYAERIKDILINLAIEDKLPMDLTTLDSAVFEPVFEPVSMSKPVFYKTKLVRIKGNVMDEVYPHLKGDKQLTLAERLGNDRGACSECDENRWFLHPKESVAVSESGKQYIECIRCGFTTHL